MQYKQKVKIEDDVGLPPIPALISIILNRSLIIVGMSLNQEFIENLFILIL